MNTQERNRKLEIFDKHKEYAMFDEILSINDRIRDIKETLSNIDVKEVKTYEEELGLLQESLKDLTNVLNGKDMVVNIPLDNLANQLVRVEQAIKNIKEVKIPDYPEFPELPEFPDTITLSDTQINELLLAINSIPQFPITELENAINNLREEFDYGFLDEKFNKLIKAIKGISISVTSGGGGFPGDLVNVNSHTKSKEVRVYQENHICQENTTSTPLAANATFTGAWQDCLNYQEVNISVATDQNSATSGLVVEWSADGVNVGDDDKFSVYANAGTNYTPNPAFRYVRVKYTNGTVQQGVFNLMTILRRGSTGGSFHRIDSTLKDDSDARLNITVPKLKTAANTYVSQTATTAGNAKVSLEELESDVSVNSNTQLRVTAFSADGTEGVVQAVKVSTGNSSTTNLAAGNTYTFTGTSASTLGIAAIQVNLFADKNCQINVQQSQDGTNWDIDDTFHYTASSSFGITVQATASYVRIHVFTNNETTTAFRLQTALCPISEPLPRSLSSQGNLKVASAMDEYGWSAENTPMGETRVIEPVRLVGSSFEGTTIDSRFWTTAASGTSAAIAQANAQILLTSGTANAATVTAYSNRRARYVGGSSMRYRAVVQVSAGETNNKRRWGIGFGASLPTVTDGAWFQLNGTEFSIVTCKGTTETKVTSFNGNLGATFAIGTGVRTYEIYWTNSKVYFVIGDEILHIVSASGATWSSTMNFHVFMDSLNAGEITGTTLAVRTATICRLGKFETQPSYYYLSGNAATHTLKLGPGILHRIIFNNTSGTNITIVDNVTGTTPVVGVITTASAALGSWDYNLPFNNGLILITTGNDLNATIVYE